MASSSTLSRRIARLEAALAVTQLVGHYARGADRRNDPEIMAPLFSRDATWEARGFGSYQGRDVIAKELARIGAEQIVWTLHYMVAPLVEINDDLCTGTCRWYLWELAQVRQGDARNAPPAAHWIGGWYESQVVFEDGQWRFAHVLLDLQLMHRHDADWRPMGLAAQ
ncbi:nuclear transport factor 2 family protein [Pandoraea communis]|uniref:SnoaL-like domain-containing protein n=1 Tax=Pandoraea communis TaxID=2508297 RepID=A0A5E4SEQ1_9BURK|nr:nuclear transport factor 2 family protein [Pandoraea communis]MDM8354781.1 nuclear transport factor 2 family protein [Pandoraea communis]VVD73583.1 hypothetical protein PCO31111_00758 [Pandoraea communis]